MMKKNPAKPKCFLVLPLLALSLFWASCGQDPIFYKISLEVKPIEPRIKGVPSNFAVFEYETGKKGMYVANDYLHRYAKNAAGKAVWDEQETPQPGGRIYALAATETTTGHPDRLFAMADGSLFVIGTGQSSWTKISIDPAADATAKTYSSIQAIYAAGNTLFAAGWSGKADESNSRNTGFAVFYETGGVLKPIKTGTALLSGAVESGGRYYLAINGAGIFTTSNLASGSLSGPLSFTGPEGSYNGRFLDIVAFVKTGTAVTAITRNGDFLNATESNYSIVKADINQAVTGAVAFWESRDNSNLRLLLVGIRSGTGNVKYGYREVALDQSGALISAQLGLRMPGEGSPSSVNNKDKYESTIGSHPINFLYQAPRDVDPEMILFAAIQGTGKTTNNLDSGVWSYRNRDGWQWNGEE
ncbi:hypothetical protein AGMMS50268_11080 [Spirochaetia bacterium]|nr:hypothetical protein AGMMS50268_11080 [Spirochaetia bacterium]